MTLGQYPPTLTVAGQRISPSYDLRGIVGIDELVFDWGADNLLDDLPPTTLHATLIDPAGSWASTADLVGQPVLVERVQHPNSGQASPYMFRGRVTEATIAPRRIPHPVTGVSVLVWQVELTAADPLAELAKLIPAPPVKKTSWWEPGDHWAQADKTNERRDALLAAARGVVAGMDTYNPQWGNSWGIAPFSDADSVDVLTQLQQMYRGEALSRAAYDAATHAVRRIPCGIVSAGLSLVADATGEVSIAGADPTIGILPSTGVQMLDDRALSTTEAAAIDVVELHFWTWDFYYKPDDSSTPRVSAIWYNPEDAPLVGYTNHYFAGKGQRRLSIDVPYHDTGGYANFASPILFEYVNRLNDLNDRWYLPPLRVDFANYVPTDASTLDALLRLRPANGWNMAMPGSIFAGLDRTAPAYQLIAGKLRWTREDSTQARWVLDGQWAPVAAGGNVTAANLSIGGLATTSTATLGDVDDLTTLGDLRHVTKGLG